MNKNHGLKTIGFKASAELVYTHFITARYPSVFIGKTKDPILSTTTIRMFESYASWHGLGAGDGYKGQLT